MAIQCTRPHSKTTAAGTNQALHSIMSVKTLGCVALGLFVCCYIPCEAGCPQLSSPEHGSVQYYSHGHMASFICEYGYILNGSTTIVCLTDEWSAEAPQCLPAGLVFMDVVVVQAEKNKTACADEGSSDEGSYGTASLPPSTPRTASPSVHYSSSEGVDEAIHFQGTSPPQPNRTMLPFVAPTDRHRGIKINIGCDVPPVPANGYLYLSRKATHRVQYTCSPGFSMKGNHTAYCILGSLGRWTSRAPMCVSEQVSVQHDNRSQPTADENPCLYDYDGCDDVCSYDGERAACHCGRGFAPHGKQCSPTTDLENVSSDFCSRKKCSHDCIEHGGVTRCDCPRGYALDNDGETCTDVDECLTSNGGCQDKCINFEGSYRCDCRRGYKLAADGRSCIQEPVRQPPPPSPCSFDNGGCTQGCQDIYGEARCYCWRRYRLGDDKRTCLEEHDPCSNIEGLRPCGDTCINLGNGQHKCECHKPGTRLHNDGRSCVDINECEDNNFGCMHYCNNTIGSAYCSCQRGFQLDFDGKRCSDIDECRLGMNSVCPGECINTPGSYHCASGASQYVTPLPTPGYETYVYVTRKPANENPSTASPAQPTTISWQTTTCSEGFQHDAYGVCIDIDECQSRQLRCSQECVNTPGSAHCTCHFGYSLLGDGMTCVDTDECVERVHACDHECVNTQGSYACTCRTGFELAQDGRSCADTNECLNNNGGCQERCVNIPGSHYCTCPSGARISSDLRSCVGVTCPALISVPNSRTECYPPIEEGRFAHAGTVCTTKCGKGYETEGTSRNRCLEDGTWDNAPPSCTAKSCPPLENPDNGRVVPERCLRDTENMVLSKCTYTCNEGFVLSGKMVNTCTREGLWRHPPVICSKRHSEISVTCPQDVYAVLPHGSDRMEVQLPRPVSTNADPNHIVVRPGYIRGFKGEFHYGSNTVTYIARDTDTGRKANCSFVVEVIDKEPPSIVSCPGSVHVYATRLEGAIVDWDEPEFEDNVAVEEVKRSQEPGTVFRVGEHFVRYTAYDTSENHFTCEFTVIVQSKECGWLRETENGDPDCNDWLYGVVCEPYCHYGYGFPRNVSSTYTCDLKGIWEPRNWVPECSQIKPTATTSCLPGSEYFDELNEQTSVCVECPPGMYWDAATSNCLFCKEGFYQDEFGQMDCKRCPTSSSSATSTRIKEQCGM